MTFCYSGPQQSGAVMSCCHVSRVTCHVSSVMSSRGDSAALSCDIIAHLDPGGHWWTLWTLVDTDGHWCWWTLDTIMMSSSADHSWVLGHCTQCNGAGGAQSAVGHTLYLVLDRASLSLYLGVIYANSLPPPGSSALLSPCCPTWATC